MAPSPATTGTSLEVVTGQGTRFATPPFNAVVCPATADPTPDNAEIVRVTGGPPGSDTFTIVRQQEEGYGPRSIAVGDRIYDAMTAGVITDFIGETVFRADSSNYDEWVPFPGYGDAIFRLVRGWVDVWIPQLERDPPTPPDATGQQSFFLLGEIPDEYVPDTISLHVATSNTMLVFQTPFNLFPCEIYVGAFGSTPGLTGEVWIDFTPRVNDPAPQSGPITTAVSWRYPASTE